MQFLYETNKNRFIFISVLKQLNDCYQNVQLKWWEKNKFMYSSMSPLRLYWNLHLNLTVDTLVDIVLQSSNAIYLSFFFHFSCLSCIPLYKVISLQWTNFIPFSRSQWIPSSMNTYNRWRCRSDLIKAHCSQMVVPIDRNCVAT